jgi:hypothetical protein
MALGTSNSPLCRITWTDVVCPPPPLPDSTRTGQHFAFQEDDPIELRFGLKFDPSFWTSFDSGQFWAEFSVYYDDVLRDPHRQQGEIPNVLGGTSEEQWIGLSFGQTTQATGSPSGGRLYRFRPQIFFLRFANDLHDIPGEFAIAPSDHAFLVEIGGSDYTYPFEHLVGGSGRPNP